MGDNALILGHRISEWTGHGPVLEQDMALTNIALDLVGQARLWYALAGELEGQGRDEDYFAYHRDGWDFQNLQLCEQPNGDFAHTVLRQFLYDSFDFYYLRALSESADARVAEIATKSLKEATYHLRYSSEWVLRLGGGTDESHRRLQAAVDNLWTYSGEAIIADDLDIELAAAGLAPDLNAIAADVNAKRSAIMAEAGLTLPANQYQQVGGKNAIHTEHLGYILAEMQSVQRAYPGLTW
jgi:ring-1,2-phenylacetyl-CoA epoxidase subunit PaaC